MKFSAAALVLLTASSAAAFSPSAMQARTWSASTRVSAAVATSFEEDLALTLKVIMDHEARSTTASKDQMLSQMKEAVKMEEEKVEPIDVSIPYDAAARLAYEASNQKMSYELFKEQYEADARSAVMAKGDLSVPYHAAAMAAYMASNRKMPWESFCEQYEAEARAAVQAKGNLSVPYDAAAMAAYAATNRKMPYALFKEQYEADARSAVMAKNSLKVNYDAAALLAYERSADRSMPFEEFKDKYEQEAIAQVIAKKEAREATN